MRDIYVYEDISHFKYLGLVDQGTAGSLWLESPDGIRYHWKNEPSRDARVNEVIACEIATQIGLTCAQYTLAIYEGMEGVLSKDIDYYGVSMRNLIEVYPDFTLIDGKYYTLESFLKYCKSDADQDKCMTRYSVANLLLFDFLIGNFDRHYGNIGIDLNTGDIAPFYDNAAGLYLTNDNKPSLLYDEQSEKQILHQDIPSYLVRKLGVALVANFFERCHNINIHDILLKLEKVMGRQVYDSYAETLPDLIDERCEIIRTAVIRGLMNSNRG